MAFSTFAATFMLLSTALIRETIYRDSGDSNLIPPRLREATSLPWLKPHDTTTNPQLGVWYSIYHYNSGKYLTVDGTIDVEGDRNIVIWPWAGAKHQMWMVEEHPWGKEHNLGFALFRIRNKYPGKCITIRQTKNEHQEREMYQYECNDHNLDQAFYIAPGFAGNKYRVIGLYRHFNDAQDRCLAVDRGITSDKTLLTEWDCDTDSWNENFYFGGT